MSLEVNIKQFNFAVGDHEISLIPEEIPTVSPSTKAIFKSLGTDSSNHILYPLKNRTERLLNSVEKLQNAQSHETRDKVLSVLRSSLTVAIVAGGILGTFFMTWCPPAAIGIAVAAAAAYIALSYYNAHSAGFDVCGSNYADPIIAIFGGAFFPIYENFGKITRLENRIAEQEKDIKDNYLELLSFFRHERGELKKRLEDKISNLEKSLNQLKQLPLATCLGEKEFETRLEKNKRALEELTKATAFYAPHRAIFAEFDDKL